MARLAVTGIGAVTSVGYRAAPAAAAIRAGIVRPALLRVDHFDEEELGSARVRGHPTGLAEGFEGSGLAVSLASLAVRDLLASAEVPPQGGRARVEGAGLWDEAALFACASPYRSDELSFVTEMLKQKLGAGIVRAAGIGIPPQNRAVVLEGHASILAALADAERAIEEGRFARALVVGVDSLVKEVDLEWLGEQGRLKTADDPAGLEPGEGAGAVLVEAEDEARRRKARVLARLEAVRIAQEPGSRADGHRGTGRGLAEAIRGALGSRKGVGSAYVDLNGEDARAYEWGMAVARLAATHVLPAAPETIAASIGDTGAASGAIQVVCATQALVRGYANGDACLVCSSADSGKVGAALLVAAGA